MPTDNWLDAYRGTIVNLRAALDWAFSPEGDVDIGMAITVAAVPLWFQLSLIDECRAGWKRRWKPHPATSMPVAPCSFGRPLAGRSCTAAGHLEETAAAWESALAAAETLGDADYRLRALWGLWAGHMNNGRYNEALGLGKRFLEIAEALPGASRSATSATVWSARRCILSAIRQEPTSISSGCLPATPGRSAAPTPCGSSSTSSSPPASRCPVPFGAGHVDQALRLVDENIEEAIGINHTLSVCNALAQSACPVTLFAGRLDKADRYLRLLAEH